MLSLEQIKELVANCAFEDWDINVRMDGDRPYLQIHVKNGKDAATGSVLEWTGRKWLLSYHMVPNEVVTTAFKAVMTAMEHEVRENFRFKGASIFNPHIDPEMMAEIVRKGDIIQERIDVAFAV